MAQNSCPRCNGLLFKDREVASDQWVEVCIICGYRRDAGQSLGVATWLAAETGVRTLQGKRVK